jgi:hypothetical protein
MNDSSDDGCESDEMDDPSEEDECECDSVKDSLRLAMRLRSSQILLWKI